MNPPLPPLCPVVLAGGEGARLWPLSRKNHPKPFLRLFDDRSLLQHTVLRLRGLRERAALTPTMLLCDAACRFLAQEHLAAIGEDAARIVLEPQGRNTAPALTIAALAQDDDAVLLMLPADHVIAETARFEDAVLAALPLAAAGRIVTFGMRPDAPDTGYGYLKTGPALSTTEGVAANGAAIFQLERFVEKPAAETARQYCASGEYCWNSGMFMLRASVWLRAIAKLEAEIERRCRAAWAGGAAEQGAYRLDEEEFARCPAASVDCAVMERLGEADNVDACALVADLGWSDVGAWDKVWQQGGADKRGNVVGGAAADKVVLHGADNTLAHAESRMVAVAGCDNLAIIETADAVLAVDKREPQQVRELLAELRRRGRGEAESGAFAPRPWGGYESLRSGAGYQVKRLVVGAGKKISLQSHRRRSEHWVVVRGTATVTCGDVVRELGVNESVFIPLGSRHRLANEGARVLEVIEVQVGDYLGEDDIERFEDDFGRV